jgi:hypothetical protein
MSAARLQVLLALVLSAAVAGFLLWRQHGELQRVRAELAAAQQQAGELEKLRAEVERLAAEARRLKADAVDPNELARLRAGITELNRLKAEKAALEKKLADAEAARARAAEAAKAQEQTTTTLPLPSANSIKSRGEAAVGPGQSAVAGGWVLPDGRRGIAMMTPKEVIQPDGSRLIEMEARVIAVPEASLTAAGLDWFLDPAQGSGVVATAEMTAALRSMNRNGGMDVLSSPKIVTGDGQQAQLSFEGKDGSPFTLDFVPKQGTGTGQVNFNYTISTGTLTGR